MIYYPICYPMSGAKPMRSPTSFILQLTVELKASNYLPTQKLRAIYTKAIPKQNTTKIKHYQDNKTLSNPI